MARLQTLTSAHIGIWSHTVRLPERGLRGCLMRPLVRFFPNTRGAPRLMMARSMFRRSLIGS